MATLRNHPIELKVAVISVLLIFYLTFSPFKSVGSVVTVIRDNEMSSKVEKMVVGSRPPKCTNRCFSCRPCMATLVASPHHRNRNTNNAPTSYHYQGQGQGRDDETYYLLAWKCKCGDKFFQP